jgi:hypothetical protein
MAQSPAAVLQSRQMDPMAVPRSEHVGKTASATSCPWCGRGFRPRVSGGRTQRFCQPRCRRSFHAAARSWALDAVAAGTLTVGDLQASYKARCALRVSAPDAAHVREGVAGSGAPQAALGAGA